MKLRNTCRNGTPFIGYSVFEGTGTKGGGYCQIIWIRNELKGVQWLVIGRVRKFRYKKEKPESTQSKISDVM